MNKINAENAVNIVDVILPQKIVRGAMTLIIGLYGFVGVFSVALLIAYCLDYFVSTVYSTYSSYDYVFIYVLIGLITVGSLIGLYGTFKYGEIDEQMAHLEHENKKLSKRIKNVSAHGTALKTSVNAFQAQVDMIMDNKQDLKSQIKAFQTLENQLKLESKSNNRK